uniref:VPS37 C-terminal domain-containing protein n=1 Tax=Photinus pyralis TaxID=7054 RepID=A0A1Y1LPZ6_PHOPY
MSLAVFQADSKRALGSLSNLTNDQLDEYINNEEKIESLLQGLNQSYLQEIEQEKETLLASNSSLSEFNLTREPALIEGRERVEKLSADGEEIYKTVEEKMNEIREKTGDMSLETALALLQTAASETEEESDKLTSQFLSNEIELDQFLEEFIEKRIVMHTRLIKAEKMAKILSSDPILNNVPSYVNAPPVNINSNYFPGINPNSAPNVPYPIGGISMPMPGNINYFQNHY